MIELPPGWSEHHLPADMWPDADMMDKLAYAVGCRGHGNIYYRLRKHWSNWRVVRFFTHSHERAHSLWESMTGTMPHSSDAYYPSGWWSRLVFVVRHADNLCGLLAERGTLAWWLTPIVSLFRWSWWDYKTRELIKDA